MKGMVQPLVSLAVILSACGGTGERACDLLEDIPEQYVRADPDDVREVADAASESDRERIRAIGDELALNLARAPGLETIVAGGPAQLIQINLDKLRGACRNLDAAAAAVG